MLQKSTQDLNRLEDAKLYLRDDVKAQIIGWVGEELYEAYISEAFENFLVALEDNVEPMVEQAIHDEELNYTPFEGE